MAAAASPLVLVVDDVADTRRLMRRVLERADIRVAEARGQIARARQPQAVLEHFRQTHAAATLQ